MADQFDFKFQSKILALLICDDGFLGRYGPIIEPGYFSDVAHQQLCEIVNSYHNQYNKPPTFEVLLEEVEKVENDDERALIAASLSEVLDEGFPEDAKYYEDKAVEFCRRQATLSAIKSAAGQLKEGKMDSILPTIEKGLNVGIAMADENVGTRYWDDFFKTEVQEVGPKIPTMLGEAGSGGMDDVLRGGLERGNVGMVMMPVGKGKSVFLLNMAGNAVLQGYNAAYISLELSERLITRRFNVFFSGQTEDELEHLPPDALRQTLLSQYKRLGMGKLLIKHFSIRSVTVRDIEAFLKTFAAKHKWFPDLLVIDYLDIIRSPYAKKDRWEQLEDISEELKGMTERHFIATWTASQVNRAGMNSSLVRNDHSAGSLNKTFAMDAIFTASPKVEENPEHRVVSLFNSKNRQGRDSVTLDFEMDFDRMRYVFRNAGVQRSVTSAYDAFKKSKEAGA